MAAWLLKVTKRYLIQVAARNLGLMLRKLFGMGTPRGLQDRSGLRCALCCALVVAFQAIWHYCWRHCFSVPKFLRFCFAYQADNRPEILVDLPDKATKSTGC